MASPWFSTSSESQGTSRTVFCIARTIQDAFSTRRCDLSEDPGTWWSLVAECLKSHLCSNLFVLGRLVCCEENIRTHSWSMWSGHPFSVNLVCFGPNTSCICMMWFLKYYETDYSRGSHSSNIQPPQASGPSSLRVSATCHSMPELWVNSGPTLQMI